jgi:predicted anti-sigma-YlaC factor YlaD
VLGGLGLAQFLLGVTQILTLADRTHVHSDQVASAGHLWHESAAWNLAIGAGFAWIASRRGRPADAVPMLTVFVVVLGLLSMGDVAAGRVEGEWLLSHAIILCGYVIIVLLARPAMHFGDPPAGRGTPRRWTLRTADSTTSERLAAASAPPQRRSNAPAARRRDAA